ncbi:MAG: endonuclease V [Bacteroidota bacterium]
MILALDVGYHTHFARVAVGQSYSPDNQSVFRVDQYDFPITTPAYIPGQFYKRELPLLLLALAYYPIEAVRLIIIDGYVDLQPAHPGLGAYLADALGGKIPIIGVAKSYFRDTDAVPILRGKSQTPLYISARGIAKKEAADFIIQLPGPYRMPDFLKAVDSATRLGIDE